VRYDTIRNQQYRAQGKEKTVRMLRPRTFYYAAILLLVGMVMLYGLLNRSPLELHVLHDRNPLFVKLSDGTIRNGYNIKILNKTHQDRQYRLVVSGIDSLQIRVQGAGNPDSTALPVFADSVGNFKVFVKASAQTQDREAVTFSLYDLDDDVQDVYQSVFISR
jgi:polyferredoxin